MQKIGLVSCVKKKHSEPQPAEHLYTSSLFIKSRRYVIRCYDQWYILSAKYGLLTPSEMIAPYDETLTQKPAAERRRWAQRVYKQIIEVVPSPTDCRLFFHAGIYYREYLVRLLKSVEYSCEAPLSGLGIGKQLAWYKRHEIDKDCFGT